MDAYFSHKDTAINKKIAKCRKSNTVGQTFLECLPHRGEAIRTGEGGEQSKSTICRALFRCGLECGLVGLELLLIGVQRHLVGV